MPKLSFKIFLAFTHTKTHFWRLKTLAEVKLLSKVEVSNEHCQLMIPRKLFAEEYK